MINDRIALKILDNSGKAVTLPNLQPKLMTTNTNGYETLTLSFMAPASFDKPIINPKNWVGMYVPFLGGQIHGEFFVDEIKIPSGLTQGESITYDVTCYGMQHIAKTNYPQNTVTTYTGAGKADPTVIVKDAELGGRLLTALGITSAAYVSTSTGTIISQKIDKLKVRNIGDWFTETLAYGDGTYMYDWAIWVDKNYGIRPNAQRTQIYFTKRDHINPVYYVDRDDVTVDAPLVMSFNQYWDSAMFHYTGNANADTITSVTAPTGSLPNFHCVTPDGEIPLTHTYAGDLGIPGGDTTVTVSTAQAAQRASAEFAADLTYRLTSSTVSIDCDKITDINGHVIPNETVRAGSLLRIRNKAILRTEQLYIDLFITQTSLDLGNGQITITPQTATDFKSNWGNPYKKKGSAHHKHNRQINPF